MAERRTILEALNKDRQLAKLNTQLEVLESRIKAIEERAVNPMAEAAPLRRERDAVKEQIATLTARLKPLIIKQCRERALIDLQQELARKAERITELEKDEANLQAELKKLAADLAAFGGRPTPSQ